MNAKAQGSLRIPIERLVANPFRDIGNYQLSEAKLKSLEESIKDTGFWDNVMARLKPEQALPKNLEDVFVMPPDKQLGYTVKLTFELAYGHHRIEAAKRQGIKFVTIPVRPLDDTTMLKVMANENKDDWSGSILVQLETVHQVELRMQQQLDSCETFAEYQKKGFDMLDKDGFAQAKKNGIGYRTVWKFLGETWSDNTIAAAHGALACIMNGTYDKNVLQGFPSIDAVRRFNALATAIKTSDNPPYIKAYYIEQCAEVIRKVGASGKTIDATTKQFGVGNDPVQYLTNGSPTPLKIRAVLKDMIKEGIDFATLEGFDAPKWKEVIEECRKEIDKQVQREVREAEKEAKAKQLAEDGLAPEEVEAKIKEEFKPETTDSGATGDESGLFEDEAPATPAAPSVQLEAVMLHSSMSTCSMQMSRMVGRVPEIDREESAEFFTSLQELFETTVRLMAESIGYKAIRAKVNEIEKNV